MHSEPNLRAIERANIGRPYGYGRLPVPPPFSPTPLGGPRQAVSRPQPMQRDPEGSKPTDRARAVLDLIDLWDRFKETFKEIPGLWRSLLGILAAPIRALRWTFTTPVVRVCAAAALILIGLFLLVIPLTTLRGRDAVRAEGEMLMGGARDSARMTYAESGNSEQAGRILGAEINRGDFDGDYYIVRGPLEHVGGHRARVHVYPLVRGEPVGYMEFDWSSGHSSIVWGSVPRRAR